MSIKGKGSITLDGKTNIEDVFFVDGLKHNLLSVGKLVEKGYHLQFTEKTCTIKGKHDKLICIGKRTTDDIFHLNPIKISCLVAKVDDNWLFHKIFC